MSSPVADAPSGVLLVNLGTPDAPTPRAVRRYLREFLGDPYVVDLPRIFWWPLLNGIILPLRSRSSAKLYQRVWTEDGSPLLFHGRALVRELQAALGATWQVELGMRYGNPSLADGLEALYAAGIERPLIVPLFPQESHTTTGTIRARVEELAAGRPFDLLASFPDSEVYVDALASGVEDALGAKPWPHVIMSFHGIPQRYADRGDPYSTECERTAAALAARLGLPGDAWSLTYQSRFGREPWLQPYTDEYCIELAAKHGRLAVLCPAFVADCLETTDEIGVELAHTLAPSGTELQLVPALNTSPAWVRALADLVQGGPREGPKAQANGA